MNSEKSLSTPVQYLKSIGPKRAESFSKIGINTIRDLLFYFPTKYLDRSSILTSLKIDQLVINGYDGEVTVIGQVIDKETIRYGKKEILKVKMRDSEGTFDCVWFQGAKFFKNQFNKGEYYALSGKPVITKYGHLQFAHPDFDKLAEKESKEFMNTGKIIPFYKVAKELKSTNLGDISLRRIINFAVENYAGLLEETLPAGIMEEHKLLPLPDAVLNLHFPSSKELLDTAVERFKFEELFYLECLVASRRSRVKHLTKGISFHVNAKEAKDFLDSLPFELTEAQLKVLHEIRSDMEAPKPMNRLLQGDVGSGKTIVALIAMLIASQNGFQAALLVPTEILADQHYKKISQLLEKFGVKVSLVLGGQKKSARKIILSEIEKGESKIIVGTHALFEEEVRFSKLGLVVIDEQHRFGVMQRASLIEKGVTPDVLIMTATPIPRTLTMTLYGDLDVSVIDQMPKDRKPIKTYLRSEEKLPQVYDFIKNKVKDGYQSILVYPLVAESEKLDLKAAETHFEELRTTVFSDYKVNMIHGKMNWRDKETVMNGFAAKDFDILVATTVVEVGIDIPDANIIVINDAYRFGLSQLHQLRGRVGRSDKQAYCLLITKNDFMADTFMNQINLDYLSQAQIDKHKTKIRLNAMINYNSGFDLSEIDLKLRGPGDIFGIKQSGLPELKFSNLITDSEILIRARQSAFQIIEEDIHLRKEENSVVKKYLSEKFSESLKISFVG
jgi:ATP-dependent DNA helicase RecG